MYDLVLGVGLGVAKVTMEMQLVSIIEAQGPLPSREEGAPANGSNESQMKHDHHSTWTYNWVYNAISYNTPVDYAHEFTQATYTRLGRRYSEYLSY